MLTYKNILDALDVGIAVIRNGDHLTDMNPAFQTLLNLSGEVLPLQSLLHLIDTDASSIDRLKTFIALPQHETTSLSLTLDSGSILGCHLKRLSWDNNDSIDLLTIQDLTRQEVRIQQLTKESQYDELTGVANRRKFEHEFSRTLEFAIRTGIEGALILFDLNDFKSINDRFGHSAGDAVLKQIGDVLSPLIRSYEMLARIGGDEFAILVSHSGVLAIERLLTQVPEALRTISLDPSDTSPTAEKLEISMGYCVFPLRELSKTEIYETADKTMYTNKIAVKKKSTHKV
jgi:diguanylate cyclase (GGDEF)-like protein